METLQSTSSTDSTLTAYSLSGSAIKLMSVVLVTSLTETTCRLFLFINSLAGWDGAVPSALQSHSWPVMCQFTSVGSSMKVDQPLVLKENEKCQGVFTVGKGMDTDAASQRTVIMYKASNLRCIDIIVSKIKQHMKGKVQGMTVCKNFKLTKKLGTGAFGEIYLAVNKSNEEEMYAAKLQDSAAKNPQLFFQAKLYKYLNTQGTGQRGIPRVYAATTQGLYNIMLMDLLGKSLEDLFVDNNKKFSLKTVLLIADQLLERIEFLHNKHFLHRDIKPDNFLTGRGKNESVVYMIDLGLSKKYIKDGKHIPYKDGKQLTGTARYASINTHIGIQQARRDDLQSIGYVLMYFLRGILPWQNMKAKDTKQKYTMIMQKKMSTPVDLLCKGFPNQFVVYLNYTKNLKFEDKPDYQYCRKLFDDLRKKSGFESDGLYDWSKQEKPQEKLQEKHHSTSMDRRYPHQESQKDSVREEVPKYGNSGFSSKEPTKTLLSKISTTGQGGALSKTQVNNPAQKVSVPKISTIKP